MRPITNIQTLAILSFKEGVRHNALKIILALSAILLGSNIFITELFTWDLGKVSVEFGLSASAFIGLLLIFFLGLKILAEDIEQKRLHLIIARPVTGLQFILGKFVGLGMLILTADMILGAGTAISMQYIIWQYPDYIPPQFSWTLYLMAIFFQWLVHLLILSVSLLWFSFAKEALTAIVLTISTYMIGQNMELLRSMTTERISALQAITIKTISWLFPNLSFFDLKREAAYGLTVHTSHLLAVIAYGLSYTTLLLLMACFFFNRREFS